MEPASPSRTGPQRRLPRALGVILLVLVVGRFLVPTPKDQVTWVPLADAPRLAAEKGRPILYDFTAAWCSPCARMEREVFADPRQAAFINAAYVPVRVVDRDMEDGQNEPAVAALKARHNVQGFPTLIVTGPDGASPTRSLGYRSRWSVIGFLKTAARPPGSRPRPSASPAR
jgi:thiol:disulfide interchange protein